LDAATAEAEEEAVKIRLVSRAARVLLPVAAMTAMLGMLIPAQAAQASGGGVYTPIRGDGSSWAAVALTQWSQNLNNLGITISFNPDGSAEGRSDFLANEDDFAASDPPFRNGKDPFNTGDTENVKNLAFSYVPDVAGGTAFMYHLDVGGHEITNLRLSGETLTKIFTGVITNWDNPEITHDYGAQLPNIPIIPVVRSDGSGATYFFTRWMSHVYPSIWTNFCRQEHGVFSGGTCPETEFYPEGWGNSKAQNGSEAVASYVSASYGQGAIGYDEYAYALQSHIPVVAVLNPGGYYVEPTASNVAVALTKAVINENPHSQNFLQQNLDGVYTFTDPRSYPLSSYSYLIVPRKPAKGQTPCKCYTFGDGISSSNDPGKTLSTYIDYYLCAGQQYSAELGYSPLPLGLVTGGLLQASKIPGAIPEPSLSHNCDNPTLKNGKLVILADAPYPSKCQKLGAPLDCNSNGSSNPSPSTSPSPGSSTGTGNGSGGTGGTNPATGGGTGNSGGSTSGGSGPVTGQVVNLASSDSNPTMFGVLTALEILAVIALPPIVYAVLRRRRQVRR
jgi:ABC-type phosphate transport system substrate-binding protein